MNNKIASILIFLLTALMILADILLTCEYAVSFDRRISFVSIVFYVVTLFMILFILFDIIIGRRLYLFKKSKIIVSRKGKPLYEIDNKGIEKATLTKEELSGKNQMLTFKYKGKKHYLFIRKDNEIALKQFISGVNVKTKDSTIKYIILYITEVFCI